MYLNSQLNIWMNRKQEIKSLQNNQIKICRDKMKWYCNISYFLYNIFYIHICTVLVHFNKKEIHPFAHSYFFNFIFRVDLDLNDAVLFRHLNQIFRNNFFLWYSLFLLLIHLYRAAYFINKKKINPLAHSYFFFPFLF